MKKFYSLTFNIAFIICFIALFLENTIELDGLDQKIFSLKLCASIFLVAALAMRFVCASTIKLNKAIMIDGILFSYGSFAMLIYGYGRARSSDEMRKKENVR